MFAKVHDYWSAFNVSLQIECQGRGYDVACFSEMKHALLVRSRGTNGMGGNRDQSHKFHEKLI